MLYPVRVSIPSPVVLDRKKSEAGTSCLLMASQQAVLRAEHDPDVLATDVDEIPASCCHTWHNSNTGTSVQCILQFTLTVN